MKFHISTIIILVALTIVGCDLFELQENGYIYMNAFAVEKVVIKDETGKITDSIKINHKFTTEIYGYLPDPCWEVYENKVEEFENEFKIIPLTRLSKKYRICFTVIKPCTTSVELIAITTADTLRVSVIGGIEGITITKTIKVIQN